MKKLSLFFVFSLILSQGLVAEEAAAPKDVDHSQETLTVAGENGRQSAQGSQEGSTFGAEDVCSLERAQESK